MPAPSPTETKLEKSQRQLREWHALKQYPEKDAEKSLAQLKEEKKILKKMLTHFERWEGVGEIFVTNHSSSFSTLWINTQIF